MDTYRLRRGIESLSLIGAPSKTTSTSQSRAPPPTSATRHHLAGAPETPEPPYVLPLHPPTGHWIATEQVLFRYALRVHSRLRPDFKRSQRCDKVLLRDGATHASAGTTTRALHSAAHEGLPRARGLRRKARGVHMCCGACARERGAERGPRGGSMHSGEWHTYVAVGVRKDLREIGRASKRVGRLQQGAVDVAKSLTRPGRKRERGGRGSKDAVAPGIEGQEDCTC